MDNPRDLSRRLTDLVSNSHDDALIAAVAAFLPQIVRLVQDGLSLPARAEAQAREAAARLQRRVERQRQKANAPRPHVTTFYFKDSPPPDSADLIDIFQPWLGITPEAQARLATQNKGPVKPGPQPTLYIDGDL